MLATKVNLLGYSRPYLRIKEVNLDGRTISNEIVEILPFEHGRDNARGESWQENTMGDNAKRPEKGNVTKRDTQNITLDNQTVMTLFECKVNRFIWNQCINLHINLIPNNFITHYCIKTALF